MKRRVLALILVFVMLLSMIPGAFAQSVQPVENQDVAAVEEMIDAVERVTPETVPDVLEAVGAYQALNEDDQWKVTNRDDLIADIEAYFELIELYMSGDEVSLMNLEQPQLASLVLRRSTAPDSEAFALEPEFDPMVHSYTVVVPDTVNPVNGIALWAGLPEGQTEEISVEYTSLINNKPMKKVITSGAEIGTTIMGCVKVRDLRENTLTIKIGEEEAYTLRLIKQPTLNDLSVSVNGESAALDQTVDPAQLEYDASVDVNAVIGVNVTTTVADVSVKLDGEEKTQVTPGWTGRDCDVVITLSAMGTRDGVYTLHLHQKPDHLSIKTVPTKTTYEVGELFDITGLELQSVYADGGVEDIAIDKITFEPAEALTKDVTSIKLKYAGLEVELPIRVGGGLLGSGTQEEPWLITCAADFEIVRTMVENGMRFEGEYLKMTDNIELPADWQPIGATMATAFAGTLDGADHLLTIPDGGLPLLGCVQGAKVSNLNIYGKKIAGYGLVNGLQGVGYSGTAISIDHVTLKSGSSTLKSGLIGTAINTAINQYAGCSKDYLVHISNCTVESGVVIGYNKDQSMIGSFAGRVNGTIRNCNSAATVYGRDYVGGILGSRDNALGNCKISGCGFTGSVIASGEQAGGIVGGGYSDSSAPNGIKISVDNCSASGNISGKDKVGGILGGDIMVAQAWDAYSFTNNSFTGKVSASGSAVGGVIGYYRSLNRLDDITGNYYASGCGAASGFGYVMYVDTNCASHETQSGALYFNTETSVADCPEVTGCAWKKAHNRTDDPLGVNAAKLMRTDGTQFIEVTGITLDQNQLDLKAGDVAQLTATVTPENATDNAVRWSSSDENIATVDEGRVQAKTSGTATINASAGSYTAQCTVNVTVETAEDIKVYMTVSNRGVLAQAQDGSAMFNREVQAQDINNDGVITYEEALIALHARYCPNGYASEDSGWGISVSKLWGAESMNFSFYLNDDALESDVGNTESSVLQAGDYLVASVNKDDDNYADHYVNFVKRSMTATVNQSCTLDLLDASGNAIRIGEWKNGKFNVIENASIDASGHATFTFAEAGTYLLTAEGSVRKEIPNWNEGGAMMEADCPIIAPGCWVTVQISPNVTISPGPSNSPEATVEPGASNTPEATIEPDASNTPEATIEPGASNTPEATIEPGASNTPSTPNVPSAKAVSLTISGSYKKTYTVGEQMNLSGMVLTLHYEDGSSREVSSDDAMISGFDTATRGKKTITVKVEGVSANFIINVTKAAGTIDVTFSILGDSKHGSGKVHTLAGGGLTTWVKAASWNVKSGSTVWDVLKLVLEKNGMSCKNSSGNYVSSVNGLGEFDNGKNSGWMYTLNGKYPLLGVSEQKLKDGDRIVFHYTDDYTLENTGFAPPATDDGNGSAGDNTQTGGEEETDMMVDAVEKMIANIGTVSFAETSKAKINAARTAYDKLSVEQKKKVENYADLQAAEKAYKELEAKEDQLCADEVIRLIDEMGSDQDKISEARAAYDALTDAQKKLVSNYDLLTQAEYQQVNSVATGGDRSASSSVIDQISAIGMKISVDSQNAVTAARNAYDALSDTQKALVTNYRQLTAAEEALEKLKDLEKFENLYQLTGNALMLMAPPTVGSIGGEWMVIGLARSGRSVDDGYYENVLVYISENMDENGRLDPNKATDNARVALALTALGINAQDADGFDLTEGLNDMSYVQYQGLNGVVWTLIALDSNAYELADGDVSREALIEAILNAQLSDGGWSLTSPEADADMTAMALQALAADYDPDVQEENALNAAVERALDCLSVLQFPDGSFGTYGPDGEMVAASESISQVIVALTSLGVNLDTDERFIKNGKTALDALMNFALIDGGFKHIEEGEYDQMATEQGYYALTAYVRYLAGETRLYDMTDVFAVGYEPEELQLRIDIAQAR